MQAKLANVFIFTAAKSYLYIALASFRNIQFLIKFYESVRVSKNIKKKKKKKKKKQNSTNEIFNFYSREKISEYFMGKFL